MIKARPKTPEDWTKYWIWSKTKKFLFEVYKEDRLLCYLNDDDELEAYRLIKILNPEATRYRIDCWGKGPWLPL
jgi:hypothetical protein